MDFSSIAPADADDTGQAVGKLFGRLETSLGHGKLKVFHSITKTATTIFEQAGVPEGITADIVGHEKATITYGPYSRGASIEQRKEAMESFEALMLQREADFCLRQIRGGRLNRGRGSSLSCLVFIGSGETLPTSFCHTSYS